MSRRPGPPQAPTEDWGVDFYYWWDAPSLYGAFWFPIPVASLHVTAAGATDLDFGPLQYRDPLPDTWSRYYVARHIAGFALPLGDGSSYSSQFVNNFTASTTGGVLAPLVGPVGDFAIGGTDAFQPHLGLTVAPRITWSPPSVGTANRYVVRVVDAASGFVALCVVPAAAALELTLRDDVLQPGHDYFLVVTALATTGNPETAPFRTTFPLGSADAISAVVTRAP